MTYPSLQHPWHGFHTEYSVVITPRCWTKAVYISHCGVQSYLYGLKWAFVTLLTIGPGLESHYYVHIKR